MLFMTTPSDRLRQRLNLPLFAGCTTRELRRIEMLSTEVTRNAGHVLCRQGDVGRECFVLIDGDVEVDTGRGHITVGPGVALGEIALLSPFARRTATLTALTDVTLRACSRTEFAELMAGLPTVAHRVLREATRRLIENAQVPAA